MSSLSSKVFSKRIILCCGSGGVGKTTTAAALGLAGAMAGKKTLVMTIDPARRLATSLGLKRLGNEPKLIAPQLLKEAGLKVVGSLHAMMLDTKRTFDHLILKFAPSPEVGERILHNRLYQHLSNMMAGSQEYMAMEKLYEMASESRWDLLILDTPPTRHALDFLEAPDKMVGLIANSILKWFLQPSLMFGRKGLALFSQGAEKVLAVFDRLAGFGFLRELSEMLLEIAGLLGGFESRAQEVSGLLKGPEVGFVLVTAPEEAAVSDAVFFLDFLAGQKLECVGILANRIAPVPVLNPAEIRELEAEAGQEDDLKPVWDLYQDYRILARRQRAALSRLAAPALEIPQMAEDISDLKGLAKIAALLQAS